VNGLINPAAERRDGLQYKDSAEISVWIQKRHFLFILSFEAPAARFTTIVATHGSAPTLSASSASADPVNKPTPIMRPLRAAGHPLALPSNFLLLESALPG